MPRKRVDASPKMKLKTSAALRTQVSTASNNPHQESMEPDSKSIERTPISSESKASTTMPITSKETEQKTLRAWIYHQSIRWRSYLLAQLALALPSGLLMLLGFRDLPKTVPLFNLLQQHPIGTPIIGVGLLVIALIPILISFFPPRNDKNITKQSGIHRHVRLWVITTVTSTLSFLVSSTLLTVVLLRPSWCPPQLCQPIPGPAGYHDANLEVSFQVFQSSLYLISGDPTLYTIAHLPQERVAAQRIDQKELQPYRVVLNVHNLLQGQSNKIYITKVALIVYKIAQPPNPLNVWNLGPGREYNTNVYNVVYRGQSVGDALLSLYVREPYGHVLLGPNETDALDIQVDSKEVVDLQFKIQITYRFINEAQLHTLTLPYVFEVVFSDGSNWHPWHLQSGQLVKG